MRLPRFLALAIPALIAGTGPALAFDPVPQTNKAFPTEHQQALRVADNESPPYAMRYTDEAAQTLGMTDGKWEAYAPTSPLLPRVNGGLDGGRPTLKLQWRPGS
ncbi:MAG: hypothetical protein U1E93_01740 [Alphaproteobacteria bacterium]